jgi:hypothetical protein
MKHWIAVASADHVRFGRSAGFMQAGHGSAGSLRRIQPGDCVAYYSPTAAFGGRDRLQAFTAIGVVKDGDPYQADMGDGFRPYRRDMRWLDSDEAPIRPLLERLAFTRNGANWGYRLRLGLFQITPGDMAMVAGAMGAELPAPRRANVPKPVLFPNRTSRRTVGAAPAAGMPQPAGD